MPLAREKKWRLAGGLGGVLSIYYIGGVHVRKRNDVGKISNLSSQVEIVENLSRGGIGPGNSKKVATGIPSGDNVAIPRLDGVKSVTWRKPHGSSRRS
jgi:hypothetical protein